MANRMNRLGPALAWAGGGAMAVRQSRRGWRPVIPATSTPVERNTRSVAPSDVVPEPVSPPLPSVPAPPGVDAGPAPGTEEPIPPQTGDGPGPTPYGSLAGAVVLLLWLYLTALAVILGGEMNAELERRRAARKGQVPTG